MIGLTRVLKPLMLFFGKFRQVFDLVWLPGLDSNQRPFD